MTTPAADIAAPPRRGTRTDWLCLGLVGFHLTLRTVCSFLTAYLLARPVLHLVLVGSISALVSGGVFARVGDLPLVLVVLTGLFGAMGFDAAYWWAGRRYEHRLHDDLVKYAGIPARRVEQAERLMGRHGLWILVIRFFQPVPNIALQMLAGAGGMTLRRYLVASVLGGLLWVGLLVGLGYAVGQPAVAVIDAITRNALKVTIGIVVLAVIWSQVKAHREKANAAPVGDEPAADPPSGTL